MWNKRKSGNLTLWSPKKVEKLHVIEDLRQTADKINESPDDFYVLSSGDFYCEFITPDIEHLPSGIYRHEIIDNAYNLVESKLSERESFIDLSVTSELEKDFQQFLDAKPIYEKMKMPYRRGVLLFGPPGTGKTSVTHNLMQKLLKDDMIVIFSHKELGLSIGQELQKDKRLKVIIFEEFTNALRSNWEADDSMLDFLDGETSLDNTFIIATTNYPEKLPKNITQRPGRFDKFYKIGHLQKDDIKKYLDYYETEVHPALLEKKDLTIAQLKEILLLMKREGLTSEGALKRLDDHQKLSESEFQNRKKVGFNED